MIIKDKILTEKDVRNLNAEKNSVVILKNTAGQSVDVLKKLSDNVCIKIIGGYDAEKKPKYNENRIQARTLYSPSEVCEIISKFEEYEKGIDPTWTDLEKALYIYIQMAENIKYEEDYGNKSRNLNTILGKGVCAGYSIAYKEAMDRLGIECDIVNEPRVHSWNVIKIDGEWYPLDLTWDAVEIQQQKNNPNNSPPYQISWFGQNSIFNKYKNHNAQGEPKIPNNCFDPQLIAESLKKVSGDKYISFKQEDPLVAIYNQAISYAKGSDIEQIRVGISEIENFAFKAKSDYNKTAYIKEFDRKFFRLFEEIKSNEYLSAEQKGIILKTIQNTWSDVLCNMGGVHLSMRAKITDLLFSMNHLLANYDINNIDRSFIYSQINKVYENCSSYGVPDIKILSKKVEEIEEQVEKMQEARNKGEKIGSLATQIQIDGPIQIVETRPVEEGDLKNWLSQQINLYESYFDGANESGDDFDPELDEACSIALFSLNAHYKQLFCNENTLSENEMV